MNRASLLSMDAFFVPRAALPHGGARFPALGQLLQDGWTRRQMTEAAFRDFAPSVRRYERVHGRLSGGQLAGFVVRLLVRAAEIYEFGPVQRRMDKAVACFYRALWCSDQELYERVDRKLRSGNWAG